MRLRVWKNRHVYMYKCQDNRVVSVRGSDPELTLHAVIILVVEAEVVRQLPAHHQLLDEGSDRDAGFSTALLGLQRHPLC